MTSTAKNTREQILDATLQLMEQRQGQGVRIEDIAHAAGVSRQAVYLHFATRSELLIATARHLDEKLHLDARLAELCAAPEGGARAIDRFFAFWAGYILEIYGLAKALLTLRETDPAAADAWNDRMASFYQGCLSIVRCLADEGTLALGWSVEEAADYFWSTASVSFWEQLTHERGWSQERYAERLPWILKRVLLREQ
jgi:AcrR family transcriptional regulator